MKSIAFVGDNTFDIAIYIGTILSQFHRKVLIINLSNSKALDCYMKHDMDLDSTRDIILYQGVYYTRKVPSFKEMKELPVEVLLWIYDWTNFSMVEDGVEEYHFFLNAFPHTWYQAKDSYSQMRFHPNHLRFTARDLVDDQQISQIGKVLEMDTTQIEELYFDFKDYQAAVDCQSYHDVNLMSCSKEMRSYISRQVHHIQPDLEMKKILRMIKKRKRRIWHE